MKNIIFQPMKTIGKSTRVPELTANPGSSPSEPFWAPCPSTSTFRGELRKLSKSMMIGKALLSGLWARPVGCWCPFITSHIISCLTVRFTVLFTTLVATRLCRCLFEVTICELLCLDGLRHVISGILAGGIPGFRMVLLLLRSPSGMALWFWCSSLCFCCHTMSRWYNVIILALISPWTGTCHASVLLFCFGLLCFALFWWVCVCFLFLACRDFMTDYWTMRRSYTSSLLRPLNLQTAMYALNN